MIGLAVYLNRKKLTVAGTEDLSVLNAIVNAVGTLGTKARVDKRKGVSLFLSVGGLTGRSGGLEDEHLRWVEHQRLRVGDRVSVRIVRTNKANKPRSAHSAGTGRRPPGRGQRRQAGLARLSWAEAPLAFGGRVQRRCQTGAAGCHA